MSEFRKEEFVGIKEDFNKTHMTGTWTFTTGEIYEVVENEGHFILCTLVKTISVDDDNLLGDEFLIPTGILEKVRQPKIDDMVRYMVYGTGCDNKSSIIKTEEKLKEILKSCVNDSGWTGRIIGYKLTPIYEAELTTKLKVFKVPKLTKVSK